MWENIDYLAAAKELQEKTYRNWEFGQAEDIANNLRNAHLSAQIANAESLKSIASSLATLAGCVSDMDATYKYLRTQPGR